MALILAFYIHRWPLLPTRHLRGPCLGLTSGYGTQARGHMDPEVACRCQLLHRQVTGVTHVRHLCIILEQLLGGGRQQPRRGSRGGPQGVPADSLMSPLERVPTGGSLSPPEGVPTESSATGPIRVVETLFLLPRWLAPAPPPPGGGFFLLPGPLFFPIP